MTSVHTAVHVALFDVLAGAGILLCPDPGTDVWLTGPSIHALSWDDMQQTLREGRWTFKDLDEWDSPEVGVRFPDGRFGYWLCPSNEAGEPVAVNDAEHVAYVVGLDRLLQEARSTAAKGRV